MKKVSEKVGDGFDKIDPVESVEPVEVDTEGNFDPLEASENTPETDEERNFVLKSVLKMAIQ